MGHLLMQVTRNGQDSPIVLLTNPILLFVYTSNIRSLYRYMYVSIFCNESHYLKLIRLQIYGTSSAIFIASNPNISCKYLQ